jgi:hypothetical protein
MGPLCLHDWTGDGDVVDAAVVVPLLSLRVEVDAGPPSDHVNDSAIRLIGEVFLFWCLGVVWVVDVWLLRVWRWEWGRYDLYLLVVLVCVVGWMLSGAMVVWLWELLICVRETLGLSVGCARDILSLVAFVSGQSLGGCAQSSP